MYMPDPTSLHYYSRMVGGYAERKEETRFEGTNVYGQVTQLQVRGCGQVVSEAVYF